MAIIITTMNKLPEHCYECPCHDGESGYCQADKEQRFSDYRPYWCPLKQSTKIKAKPETASSSFDYLTCDPFSGAGW